MDTLLFAVGLVVAVAALVLALTLRSRLAVLEKSATAAQRFEEDAGRRNETMHVEIGDLRRLLDQTRSELDAARGEVVQLKAAAEVPPPPPPLPKARSARLDDLRQQLRAAHTEGDDSEDT